MADMVYLNAKGIIAVYSMLVSTHLKKEFSLSEIMKFRDALDARLAESGIPVRCRALEELDLYEFWDCELYGKNMEKLGSCNAYNPDTQIMNITLYKDVVIKDVKSKILEPLNITGACLTAFFSV